MNNITKNTKLKSIVILNPSSYKILEKYNLDYCCNGNKTLEESCKEKSLDSAKIIQELKKTETLKDDSNVDKMTLTELASHIENTHHIFMKKEIHEILSLLDKVINRHKTKNLIELKNLFEELSEEVSLHFEKEEKILFPAIKELEKYGKIENFACFNKTQNSCAAIKNLINQMELEHINAGKVLEKINKIIDAKDFIQCTSMNILFNKLKAFQEDLHRHIHKENYILFPKVIALENKAL